MPPWSKPWRTPRRRCTSIRRPTSSATWAGRTSRSSSCKNGRVKDFKLNTQCSAGNGYFLQSTAQGFGYEVDAVRRPGVQRQGHAHVRLRLRGVHAVGHRGFPAPGMEAGRDHGRPVQRAAEEHLAVRLADSQHRFASATRFLLQGGTQYNLAVVKAQVDFIESRFKGKGGKPNVIVHEHCGEVRRDRRGPRSEPALETGAQDHLHRPGRRAEDHLHHAPQRRHSLLLLQEQVPAHLHRRQDCSRAWRSRTSASRHPRFRIAPDTKRLIINNSCENGLVEDINAMHEIKKGMDSARQEFPEHGRNRRQGSLPVVPNPPSVADPLPRYSSRRRRRRASRP